MAVVVGPGRKFGINGENETRTFERELICTPEDQTAAAILISLGAMGIGANLALMAVILLRRPLRRSVISKIVRYLLLISIGRRQANYYNVQCFQLFLISWQK